MRCWLVVPVVASILTALPAAAGEWARYENGRFGYVIEMPQEFIPLEESGNGDGRAFEGPVRDQTLVVWGAFVQESFAGSVDDYRQSSRSDGWRLTYDVERPHFASLSGVKGQHVFYQRLIPSCDGRSFASFRFEYAASEVPRMNLVVRHLVQSFRLPEC